MRTLPIAIALLFAGTVLLYSAPPVAASGVCTDLTWDGCQDIVCVRAPNGSGWTCPNNIIVCIKDGCP